MLTDLTLAIESVTHAAKPLAQYKFLFTTAKHFTNIYALLTRCAVYQRLLLHVIRLNGGHQSGTVLR